MKSWKFALFAVLFAGSAFSADAVRLDGKITAITQSQVVIQTTKSTYVLNRAMVSPKLDPQIVQRPTHFIVSVSPAGIQSVKPIAPTRRIASVRVLSVD
jgi:hypothetical protein